MAKYLDIGTVLALVFGAVSLVGLSPPEFLAARICVIIAAALLIARIVLWMRKSNHTVLGISGTVAVAIALIGALFWIKGREAMAQTPSTAGTPVTIIGGDNVVSVGQIGGITAKTVTIDVDAECAQER